MTVDTVKVPESFRKEILGESYQPVEEPEEVVEEVVQEGEMITEETAQEMVSLLKDVRNLLSEMMTMGTTSAGSIGVNLAGPTKPKKKKKESALRSALRQRRGLR